MGHYAKVIKDIVINVIVADNEWVNQQEKIDYIDYIETSYNIYGGVYYDPETGQPHKDQSLATATPGRKRKNYAGIGWTYDKQLDAFIPPKPFESWTLDKTTCTWQPPVPYPDDFNKKMYLWNEIHKEWTLVE